MDLMNIQYGILGHMILFPEHVGEIMTRLGVADFDSAGTRGLFEAIGHLHFAGKPIDRVTVEAEAGPDYEPAVEEALHNAASDWAYYCDLLREGVQLKRIHGCANELAAAGTMEDAGRIIDKINGLGSLRPKTKIITAKEAAADFVRRMSENQKPEYMSLGIPEMDRLLYLEPGDFVLLGGLASSGKTLLSLQIALSLTKKYRVGYFTLETNPRKLTDRMVAHMAQVPLPAIKEHCLVGDDARRAADAIRRIGKLDLDFIHSSGMDLQDIRAITLSKRYQVIFVDYLQIIDANAKKSRYEEVTGISIGLHTLAQSNGITVFALAQLSRPEKTRDGKLLPPSLSSFRESGQLEQDADVALLIWPEDLRDNNSNRKVKIAKNKEGGRGTFIAAFNGLTQTLSSFVPDQIPGGSYSSNTPVQTSIFRPVPANGATPFDNKT